MTFAWSRLADYFTAVGALDAENDAEKQRAIAMLLGLIDQPEAEKPAPPIPPKRIEPSRAANRPATPHESSREPVTPPPVEPAPPAEPPPAEPPRRSRSRPRLDVTLTPTSPEKRTRPDWLEHVLPLAPPRAEVARVSTPMPLFARRTSRAVLSTAMATDRETNAIDLDAIVAISARGLPIQRVPRRVIPSLSHGIQLLVDRGPSAEPFLADQDSLVEQIRVVAGRDRVQVLRFDPSRAFIAGSGPRFEWVDYFAIDPRPLPGIAVVLLSDLGIATVPVETSATADEWRRFIARIRARGNPVLAFVPYGRARWPAALRNLATMLTWDRKTSIQAVRSARK
jgi:hypothetical protein